MTSIKEQFIAYLKEAQTARFLLEQEQLITFKEYNGRLMLTDASGFPFDLEYAHLFLQTLLGEYLSISPGEIDAAREEYRLRYGGLIAKAPEAPKRGRIYLLHSNGMYKIGYTTRKVGQRVDELQAAWPYPITLVHFYFSPDVLNDERVLHEKYADKRGNGEWFNLSSEDVEYITSLGGDE